MSRSRLSLVLLVALVGAVVSGALLLQHHGEPLGGAAVSELCGEAGVSGCDAVNQSRYAAIGGVPLAALGVFFYTSLLALLALGTVAGAETRTAAGAVALLLVGLALVADVVLLALQAFAIGAYCRLCLLTYALNAAALATLWPARRAFAALRSTLTVGEGRLVVSGWVIASLAVAGAGWSLEAVLLERQSARAASVLGAPVASAPVSVDSPPPAATPSSSGSASELEAYKEEARRLKETLEDPAKLQRYLDEKAARDFDTAPRQQVDLRGTPVKGPPDAGLQVVEYSDFLCPYCRSVAAAFNGYVPQSGNRVAIFFKHYPLDPECNSAVQGAGHAGACWLAKGGICAQDQGKFWAYHDKVFGSQLQNPKGHEVVRLGVEAGLDQSALESCMISDRTKQRLAADIAEGRRVGVSGTPTLLINGKRLPRLDDFFQALENEARRKRIPPPPRPTPQ
jgi:protein-disulfide isomerase/uncharacterized membrane protein